MDKVKSRQGPVLIELDPAAMPAPADAPPLPEPTGRAMQTALALGARQSRLGSWFLASALSLVGFLASLAAWNYVAALMASHPLLGWIATGLFAAFLATAAALTLRETAAYVRLGRLDQLRARAGAALAADDLAAARAVAADVAQLYRGRADLSWGADGFADRARDVLDATGLIDLTERTWLAPLDHAARREVEGAARQVATVTAIVPLALADVVTALFANLRMVRRIAEVYGGRAGLFGSWRLMRQVMLHLVATGAVAVGDDLIHSVAGGGILSKLSRRFGEGVINGALTARVGLAAIEVCRPLPFHALPRPKVSNLIARGLRGLFGGSGDGDEADRADKADKGANP